MTNADRELEVAEALARVQAQKARGESPDLLAYRDRLGDSHGEFVDLLQVDSMIDDVTDPPATEKLPHDLGDYRLLRELGRGAIGVVYEAWHKVLGRKVAIKVLSPALVHDLESRDRFRGEAFATAQVRHPHIVEIFDAGEIDGRPFYAMDLIEGRPLSALIASKELPPLRDLCRELAGVADALDTLHRAKAPIIHRDVKPANIMVRPDGRMILADFGLARTDNGLSLTRTGVAIGTPLYMPPEQILGRKDEIDGRADVYALGATLYEAVALRTVFPATTYEIVAKQVVSESPVPLRRLASACPLAVERIAMKALAKRREDRHQTAAAMRDQLLLVAEGKDEEVQRPVGPIITALRAVRSPTGLAAAAAVLLALGAGLWWTSRSARMSLTSSPNGAEVLVGDASLGRTPLSVPLKPGAYDLVVKREHFKVRQKHFDVSAGAELYWDPDLSPGDSIGRIEIADAVGVDTGVYKLGGTRAAGVDPLVFVYPRGSVRIEDLDQYGYEVDVLADPPTGGELQFRAGEKTLYSEPFKVSIDSQDSRRHAPFPEKVRAALHVGDVVSWGLRFPPRFNSTANPKDVVVSFTVVEVGPSAGIAEFAKAIRTGERSSVWDDGLRGELEVRKLWSVGLKSAALARADELADRQKDVGELQALARQAHARLNITDSGRVRELEERIARLPKAMQEQLENAALDGAEAPPPTPSPNR